MTTKERVIVQVTVISETAPEKNILAARLRNVAQAQHPHADIEVRVLHAGLDD